MAAPAVTEQQALFSELRRAVLREHFEKALSACARLKEEGCAKDEAVVRSECLALIQLGRLDAALALSDAHAFLGFERAYTLYRIGRQEEARQACDAAGAEAGEAFHHLRAQLDYRTGRAEEAKTFYGGLTLQEAQADGAGVHDATVNYLATVGSTRDQAALEAYIDRFGDDIQADYEIAYNAGVALCAGLEAGRGERVERAGKYLRSARELCMVTLEDEGLSKDDIAEECGIIDIALSFILSVQGLEKDAIDLCMNALQRKSGRPVDVCVAANNLTVFRGQRDLFDSFRRLNKALASAQEKLSPAEILTLRCNRCLLLWHMSKFKEYEAAVDELRREYPEDARIFLMEKSMAFLGGESPAGLAGTFEAEAARLSGAQSVRIQLAAAQLHFQAGDEARAMQLLAALQDGYPEISGSPGLVATILSMFDHQERHGEAQALLAGAVKTKSLTPRMMLFAVEYCIRLGDYAGAVKLVDATEEDSTLAASEKQAELQGLKVVALSWLVGRDGDVEEVLDDATGSLGVTEADLLPVGALEDEDMSILDLERTVPQRARRRAPKKLDDARLQDHEAKAMPQGAGGGDTGVEDATAVRDLGGAATVRKRRGQTNPERVRARRAKRKAEYLEKLAAEGKYNPSRPAKPDPERWLPRKQRSYNKRGKRRNQFVGAQGSGDGAQKDAAKFDVAARVAEKLERGESAKEAKSSAQATVSTASSGRRTKKRGKKK